MSNPVKRFLSRVNWIMFTVFDLQLQRRSQTEHGDVFHVLPNLLEPGDGVILDVGARTGGTVFGLHELFPRARIHCFEPFQQSFEMLESRFRSVPEIRCNHMAITESSGSVKLNVSRTDSTSSILDADPKFGLAVDPRHVDVVTEEQVNAVSIDDYCVHEVIDEVMLLKLDIQGAELIALRGAEHLLGSSKIDAILTEVSFARMYQGQGMFWEVRDLLEHHGYSLFGLYDLRHGRNGLLAWGDALFVSGPVAARLNQPWAQSSAADRVALAES